MLIYYRNEYYTSHMICINIIIHNYRDHITKKYSEIVKLLSNNQIINILLKIQYYILLLIINIINIICILKIIL